VSIDLREHILMQGVLALVVSLSEVIKDALKLQALDQMREKGMSDEEVEGWKLALMDLDAVLDKVRSNGAMTPALQQLGPGFNRLVENVLTQVLNPSSPTR